MAKLVQKQKKHKQEREGKPTVLDLHGFPDEGIHAHLFDLALFLKNWSGEKITPSEAVDLIDRKFHQSSQRRKLQRNEVENAVSNAFNSSGIKTKGSKYIFKPKRTKTSPESVWPESLNGLGVEEACKRSVKQAIEDYSWSVEAMMEDSPVQATDWPSAEILGQLHSPSDLICCGTLYKPRTRELTYWLENGISGDLFCPNPMRAEKGINLSGKLSERCRDNTGRRKFLVYECDDTTLGFDAKAALIRCLWEKTEAKLRMIVHSGGKSLHAMFEASDDEEINWQFMNLAVKYGGDPRMYWPEQLSRLPNAHRLSHKPGEYKLDENGNKIRQECLYLDPK